MPDVECIIKAAKAAWIPRLVKTNENATIINYYLHRMSITLPYFMKCNVTCEKNSTLSNQLPAFYLDVFLAFNQCKQEKNILKMNSYDFLSQPLWYNKLLLFNGKCLWLPNWAKSGILYVKDLFEEDGSFIMERTLRDKLESKRNWIAEYSMIYTTINRLLKQNKVIDTSISHCINIKHVKENYKLNTGLKFEPIKSKKSNFFYKLLLACKIKRSHVEKYWSSHFNFKTSSSLWEAIYKRNIIYLHDKKLCEFKYKVLHNLVVTNTTLKKWKISDSDKCINCGETETLEHMLFKCCMYKKFWDVVTKELKISNIYKHIVLGYDCTNTIGFSCNLIIAICAYSLYCYKYNNQKETCSFKIYICKQLSFFRSVFKIASVPCLNAKYFDISLNNICKSVI